jgi:hypothetical protein
MQSVVMYILLETTVGLEQLAFRAGKTDIKPDMQLDINYNYGPGSGRSCELGVP